MTDNKVVDLHANAGIKISGVKNYTEAEMEEMLGIWAMYTVSGRTPEHVSMEDLHAFGQRIVSIQQVTSLFNGLMYRERQLVERLIDDNAIKDIILRDKLNVTNEDFEKAEKVREQELAKFQEEMKTQIAKAQADLAKQKEEEGAGV